MTTTSRSARYAKWLSIPLGLAISALLIWQASYAAFSDTATSEGNTWTTGNVKISHDRTGSIFEEKDLAPGDFGTETLTATYEGNLDADIRFFGRGATTELAKHIRLVIEGSAGDTFGSPSGEIFNGTLAEFITRAPTYADSQFRYTATNSTPKQGTFKFTYTVLSDIPDELSGQTATIDFILEARSLPRNG